VLSSFAGDIGVKKVDKISLVFWGKKEGKKSALFTRTDVLFSYYSFRIRVRRADQKTIIV